MNRTQYIFVDYENVHEVDLGLVAGKAVAVELVIGEQHKNLPVTMVDRLLEFRDQVKLVKAGKSGRNALDFVLAYRVGAVSITDAQGYFHIVSRDTGFDALIAHLRHHHILARRDDTFVKAFETEATTIPASDRPKLIMERLKKSKANRPKRKKTLISQINSYFGKKLTETELENIVQTLIRNRLIEVGEKGEITYQI